MRRHGKTFMKQSYIWIKRHEGNFWKVDDVEKKGSKIFGII
jgi:hypothetical protein